MSDPRERPRLSVPPARQGDGRPGDGRPAGFRPRPSAGRRDGPDEGRRPPDFRRAEPFEPADSRRPRGKGGWTLVLMLVVLGGLLGWLASEYGDRFDWSRDWPRLVYVGVLLAVLVAGAALRGRTGFFGMVKGIVAWAAIGLVFVIGYAYRTELTGVWHRVAGEIDTSRATPAQPRRGDTAGAEREDERALSIRQSGDGHYYATARINGADTRLLVDTGATVTVLSIRHAERAGIFPSASQFTAPVRTASGVVKAAPVVLRDFGIGDARLNDVRALVMDTPGDVSLLGIDTLQRFKSYEVRDGVLTLRW